MPRPEPSASLIPGSLPLEYTSAKVDAPDARYEIAIVHVLSDSWTVVVYSQRMAEIGRYVLDGRPEFVDGSVVGLSDGMPVVVSKDPQCTCNGTRKAMKHAR